MFATDLQKLLR